MFYIDFNYCFLTILQVTEQCRLIAVSPELALLGLKWTEANCVICLKKKKQMHLGKRIRTAMDKQYHLSTLADGQHVIILHNKVITLELV